MRFDTPIRLLVVDDSPAFVASLSSWVASHPNLTLAGVAPDTEQALALLEVERPDVVLMDLALGGASGLDALREVKRRHPGLRVVVLTLHDGMRAEAALAGADGFVSKAAITDSLYRAVRAAADPRGNHNPEGAETMTYRTRSSAAAPAAQPERTQRVELTGVLAAGLAHEINNALTALFSHLSMLARRVYVNLEDDKPAPAVTLESARRHLVGAQEAANHMAGVVRDVLGFVRAAPPVSEVVNVRMAVERALGLSRYCTRDAVEVRARLDEVAPVAGGATAVTQIALNVILNAIAAFGQPAPEGARIDIILRQHSGWVALDVHDNGPGVSAEIAERLFRPLVPGELPGGGGLGLPITVELVRGMGGQIEVSSQNGVGTSFRVLWPIAATRA